MTLTSSRLIFLQNLHDSLFPAQTGAEPEVLQDLRINSWDRSTKSSSAQITRLWQRNIVRCLWYQNTSLHKLSGIRTKSNSFINVLGRVRVPLPRRSFHLDLLSRVPEDFKEIDLTLWKPLLPGLKVLLLLITRLYSQGAFTHPHCKGHCAGADNTCVISFLTFATFMSRNKVNDTLGRAFEMVHVFTLTRVLC